MFRLLQHPNSICRYQLQVAAFPRGGKVGFDGADDPKEAEHDLGSALEAQRFGNTRALELTALNFMHGPSLQSPGLIDRDIQRPWPC